MNSQDAAESSILILGDGRVLARNVTPSLAAVLLTLQPENAEAAIRAGVRAAPEDAGATPPHDHELRH
jgi:hypothetical protein